MSEKCLQAEETKHAEWHYCGTKRGICAGRGNAYKLLASTKYTDWQTRTMDLLDKACTKAYPEGFKKVLMQSSFEHCLNVLTYTYS